MSEINYDDKVDLIVDTGIDDIFKVTASDMNEIKNVVNGNAEEVGDITSLTTTDKTNVVNAVNELNAPEKWVAIGKNVPTDGRRVWFKKGKNLLNLNRAEVAYSVGIVLNESNMYSNMAYDGGVGTANTQNIVDGETLKVTSRYSQGVGFPIKCNPNEQYSLTLSNTNNLGSVCILFFDENNTYLSNSGNSHTETLSVTTPSNCKWLVVLFDVTGGTRTEVSFSNIQVKQGTPSTYEPYIEQGIYVDNEILYQVPKVLWQNPSPTSSFASQTITLGESITNYKYYEVLYKTYKDENIGYNTGKIPVEWSTNLYGITNASDGGVRNRMRAITINSPTQIEVASCSLINTKGDAYTFPDDNRLIPYKILGYKE